MLENWLLPQLNTNYDYYFLQLEGPPHHFHTNIQVLLKHLPQCWNKRAANGDNNLLPWPPRLPDLTPCDFFLWGFVKYIVYVLLLPTPIQEFHDQTMHAPQAITADMLH
jgi:hypothetical protein